MGGLRTAGDLVARMQMTRGMKLDAAKSYVADKLGVGLSDLHDEPSMCELRREKGIGNLQQVSGSPKGLEAKCNIARLLEIEINSLKALRRHLSL